MVILMRCPYKDRNALLQGKIRVSHFAPREEKHRTGNGLAEKFWQRLDGHHRAVCGPAVPSIVVNSPLAHGEVITAHLHILVINNVR
jgi:hypothetical protein